MPTFEQALQQEIARVKTRLAELTGLTPVDVNRRKGFSKGPHRSRPTPSQGRAKRRRRISPQRQRQLKIQGVWMAALRQLTAAQKSQVKKVRAEQGFKAAVSQARQLRQTKTKQA